MPSTRKRSSSRWGKGGGNFGPITTGSETLDIEIPSPRPPGRLKPGEGALLEIEKYQGDGGYLIPKKAFNRLAREVFKDAVEGKTVSRIERSAMEALQTATESHMSMVLNGRFCAHHMPAYHTGANVRLDIAGGISAVHAGRQTLRVPDLEHVEQVLLARAGSSETRGKGKGVARQERQRGVVMGEESVSSEGLSLILEEEEEAEFTDGESAPEDSEDLQFTSADSELEDIDRHSNHDEDELNAETITVPPPPNNTSSLTKDPTARKDGKGKGPTRQHGTKRDTVHEGRVGKSTKRARGRRRVISDTSATEDEGEGNKAPPGA